MYISVVDADTYFDERLNSDAWEDATTADKTKALITSTRMIDRLNFRGNKTVATQSEQFPRGEDTEVPDDIKYACCEIAIALLDGVDPELEFENLDMVSQGYANVRSTYNRSSKPEHLIAGIMSIIAWRYLKPYLRDPTYLDISRVS